MSRLVKRRSRALLLVAGFVCCVAIAGCADATSPAVRADRANRARATAAANELLREARATTRRTVSMHGLTTDERTVLTYPFGWLQIASAVDRYQLWRTSTSPVTAVDAVVRALPRGTESLGRATSGDGGEVLADYRLPASNQRLLGTREISVTAISDSSGTTVRLDAEVAYVAPRPPNQRIPSAARVLDVTVGNPKRPSLSLTVTNRSKIREVADMVNALPFDSPEKGAVYSCPLFLSGTSLVTFVFRSTDRGPALAMVSEYSGTPTTPYPCAATWLVIRGHNQPDLQDGGRLLKGAGALLKVRLRSGV